MSQFNSRPYGIVGLLLLAFGLVIGANVWKSNLKVKQVTVEGNRIVETNEIAQLAQVQLSSLLYDADLTLIQRNVMSHHYVKDANIERDLPSTIRISIVERTPIALVNGAEMFYLDEDGVILPQASSRALFDLPILSGIPNGVSITLGARIDQPDVGEALQVLSTMKLVSKEWYHRISEVQLRNGGDVILYSAESGVPIIFGKGDIAEKMARLETFWKDVVRDRGSQNLQYVDLRYQDQVVVRWNKEDKRMKAL